MTTIAQHTPSLIKQAFGPETGAETIVRAYGWDNSRVNISAPRGTETI